MSGLSVHMLVRKVDLLTLRLFLSVVEERQISRAAIRENIAISAVTKRIKSLEDFAGTQLLDRSPRGVVPSKAGQALVKHLRVIFGSLEDMRREISDFTDGVRGHVRVATPVSVLVQGMARQIRDFTRNFPSIDLELLEDINSVVVRAVKTGDADLCAFVQTQALDTADLETHPYRTDRLVAIYPADHPFSERTSVALRDLLEERIIGVRPKTTLMSTIQNAAKTAGHDLPLKYSVSSPGAALCLVENGLGVTVLPECMFSVEHSDRVGMVSIAEDWAERRIFIANHKERPLSAAAKLLLDHLSDRISIGSSGKARFRNSRK